MNKVILTGNLGADPEVRYTQSGIPVATFSVATTERWKDKDGNKQESTEWHRVVVWNRLAEIAGEYLSKGSKVLVEGKMVTRKWQDQGGNDRYTTEVVLSGSRAVLEMLSPSNNGSGNGHPPAGYGDEPFPEPPVDGDDVPF